MYFDFDFQCNRRVMHRMATRRMEMWALVFTKLVDDLHLHKCGFLSFASVITAVSLEELFPRLPLVSSAVLTAVILLLVASLVTKFVPYGCLVCF